MGRFALKRKMRTTTICTPTYIMTRDNPKLSSFMGWILFILFLFCLIFLFLGISVILTKAMVPWVRNCLIGAFSTGVFIVLVCLFMVDTMTSIEEHLSALKESQEKSEEHLYAILKITAGKK